ncbi:MAG: hypothetical protein LBP89_00690 [Helicobacteraceae bacterium]|nr:hypothetical protein [Helicobacteraceae bacterium]
MERGELNPSIAFLKRLAKACDMRLTITVSPQTSATV